MITVKVKITSTPQQRQPLLLRGAKQLVDRTTALIETRARFYAPHLSRNLQGHIEAVPAEKVSATRVTGRVECDVRSRDGKNYAIFQHEGTGIYGPVGRPIVPVRAPYLVFWWRKTNRIHRRKSVRGTKPTKFLIKAVRDICVGSEWRIKYYTKF